MHLSDYSLRQMDDAYLQSLEVEALRNLSLRWLADLQEARERLNQGPTNRSRPPSSRAPWERGGASVTEPAEATPTPEAPEATPASRPATNAPARKPGQQPGAPGFGRAPVLTAHHVRSHDPATGAGCGRTLTAVGNAVAYTGFQAIDLHGGEPGAWGLSVEVTDHRYYEVTCPCGHHPRAEAGPRASYYQATFQWGFFTASHVR